jgi:hypothetical protein
MKVILLAILLVEKKLTAKVIKCNQQMNFLFYENNKQTRKA